MKRLAKDLQISFKDILSTDLGKVRPGHSDLKRMDFNEKSSKELLYCMLMYFDVFWSQIKQWKQLETTTCFRSIPSNSLETV
jgi:hypothetical protein